MAPNLDEMKDKGQALMEALIGLPLLLGLLTAVLFLLAALIGHYLVIEWVDQASLCLAQEHSQAKCKKKLTTQLKILHFLRPKINSFGKNLNHIKIKLSYHCPVRGKVTLNRVIQAEVSSNQFRIHL